MEDEIYEVNVFLYWFCDNYFLFLGLREYDLIGDLEIGDLVFVEGISFGVLWDFNFMILRCI